MRKNLFYRAVSVMLITILLAGSLPLCAAAEQADLQPEQKNAIAMLNYITVLTQDINASRNSRLYLEEAYSSLVNNVMPDAIDGESLRELRNLLDIMEGYRMIEIQRERIRYMYEQEEAQELRELIPIPVEIKNFVNGFLKSGLLSSLLEKVGGSVADFAFGSAELGTWQFEEWDLDDEEEETLHQSRKDLFSYMVRIVQAYKIPGYMTLTEASVEEFVNWKNNGNVTGRIRFLETNRETYGAFGSYWLLLAQSYYENADYGKCLEALDAYEALDIRIFRKDYDLAKTLPMAIVAADKACSPEEYTERTARYVQTILDNTDHDDWELRYFAASAVIDLYARTGDGTQLENAYSIVLDNVNYLVAQQRKLNGEYLAPVQTIPITEAESASKMAQIISYNRYIKELRATELAPVCEPLRLNCDLLFALAEELDISAEEQKKVEGILHQSGAPLFLNATIDAKYWFVSPELKDVSERVVFGGTGIIVPVEYLPEEVSIRVTVKEADSETEEVFTDWALTEVKREKDDDISSFGAVFTSENAKKHTWKPNADITVTITPVSVADGTPAMTARYTSVNVKNNWYDHLKVWEGQNNNWYDYLNIWDVKVNFEKVTP